jgi:hypothetical protein
MQRQSPIEIRPLEYNRDIRKVRKRQGEYPEFGHTQGEIQKKPAKKKSTLAVKGGGETQKTINFCWFPESHPVFLFS